MAKKKVTRRVTRKKSEEPEINIGVQTSNFLNDTLAAFRVEYNDVNIAAAGEAGRIVVGVPFPGLALEYLFQNTVYPLSRMTQVVGTEGTCKSAFCFEIVRWFSNSDGFGVLFENETKYSPNFALSIIGYPEDTNGERLMHLPCSSIEDWQSKIQSMNRKVQKQMEDKGRVFPVVYILDSIMGKLSEETQEKIEKDGFVSRSYPVEALKITNWLKKFPQDIEEWPISFLAVNHLKPQKSQNGPHMERNKAGGRGISFQETFEIELKRTGKADIRLVDEDENGGLEICGLRLKIVCKKNSLGDTGRSIITEVKWRHVTDPVTGESRQVTKWDWPASLVFLLASFDKGKRREKIRKVVDVTGSGNRWYSKKYGITSTDPVSAHELGLLIEADEEVKTQLRRLFGIQERKVFNSEVDYLDQLAEVREKVSKNINNPSEFDEEAVPISGSLESDLPDPVEEDFDDD